MTNQKISTSIQHKLMLKLLELNFTLQYKKGKENVAADALSRKHSVMAISLATPQWISAVENSYCNDATCKSLLEKLLLSPNHVVDQNTLHSGIIRHKGQIYVGKDLDLRKKLLTALHASALGGHSGMKATYHRIKRIFYWPCLKQEVDRFVFECPICQKTKGKIAHILVTWIL